jgi:hypothetical protein
MRLSVMFVIGLAAACTTPSHPGDPGPVTPGVQVQTGREFDLGFGQEVQVKGTSLSVRFAGVWEDSRCAVDVQCVWAGNAIVRLALYAAGTAATEASLNTTLDPKSVTFAGYSVRLAGLKPLPRSGTAIPGSSYVATLEIRPL